MVVDQTVVDQTVVDQTFQSVKKLHIKCKNTNNYVIQIKLHARDLCNPAHHLNYYII